MLKHVFYVSWRFGGVHLHVCYVSGMLGEAYLYVFSESGRLRRGPASNDAKAPGGFPF